MSTRALHGEPAENGCYAVVAAFTDITERREAQRALERSNAELAQFAYVASHDLPEPLRMVQLHGAVPRRYQGRLDEQADEYIRLAVAGADRMRALIQGLLAYSRPGRGAGRARSTCGHVMADVLSSLAAAVADASRAGGRLGRCRPCSATGSRPRQVLQNLVANALKFRSGPSAVRVDRGRADAQRDVAGQAWADDGIGIDPRHRERVFKMFQRLHDREAFEGTGIGLAICRKIIERQGGEIGVDARAGGGSVFSFTVPAVPAPALVDPATGGVTRVGTPVA